MRIIARGARRGPLRAGRALRGTPGRKATGPSLRWPGRRPGLCWISPHKTAFPPLLVLRWHDWGKGNPCCFWGVYVFTGFNALWSRPCSTSLRSVECGGVARTLAYHRFRLPDASQRAVTLSRFGLNFFEGCAASACGAAYPRPLALLDLNSRTPPRLMPERRSSTLA